MMNILVTGATGFIGEKLTEHLLEQPETIVHLAVRRKSIKIANDKTYANRIILNHIGDISSVTDWHQALANCEVVVHTAGRVHIMNDLVSDPLMTFREVNVGGTLNLARQAAEMGVKRFIYLSSIKVNGEYTQPDCPFSPDDVVRPEHPYAISKYEAEQGLRALAEKSQMELVIIRPPLVYGPGVSGNFLRMMQLLHKGSLLPFGALTKNKRSYVSVNNLVHLIALCITHPQAANQTFLISDNEDLSTTDLFRRILMRLENRMPLIPVPAWILNVAATLLRRKPEMMRICGSLQVDISKSEKLLNWQPIESLDDALSRTVSDYMYVEEV
jgi:nucleoside-diphosphate-sugar epimerase